MKKALNMIFGMMEMDQNGKMHTTAKYANTLKNSLGRDAARAVYRAAGGRSGRGFGRDSGTGGKRCRNRYRA